MATNYCRRFRRQLVAVSGDIFRVAVPGDCIVAENGLGPHLKTQPLSVIDYPAPSRTSPMRSGSLLRVRHYINLLLTYLVVVGHIIGLVEIIVNVVVF